MFGDNVDPQAEDEFEDRLAAAARTGQGEAALFESLREVSTQDLTRKIQETRLTLN